jgi:hypothetical protein
MDLMEQWVSQTQQVAMQELKLVQEVAVEVHTHLTQAMNLLVEEMVVLE